MIVKGKAYWTKLDKAVANYNKTKKIMKDGQPDGWGDEWSIEVANLTADTKKALKKEGLLSLVKNKLDEREDFITFRLSTEKRDGTPNDPPKVVDEQEKVWDWDTRGKIGNDSDIAVKFNVWKNPGNGKASAFIVAVKVLNHIPYETEESDTNYEDPNDWGDLDDDIAF
jgi:hypothetical protein